MFLGASFAIRIAVTNTRHAQETNTRDKAERILEAAREGVAPQEIVSRLILRELPSHIPTARELLALSAWRAGDQPATRRWGDLILSDAQTPANIRGRVEMLMAVTGGRAKG